MRIPPPFLMILMLAPAFAGAGMTVQVTREGDEIIIDGTALIPFPLKAVWEVLTDYEHMARFVPDITVSRVIRKDSAHIRVEQKGIGGVGPFRMAVETVRDVEITPYQLIRSRLISGTLKKLDAETRLTNEAGSVHLIYHASMISDSWVPPGIGPAVIRQEVAKQFDAMIEEMGRRHATQPDAGSTAVE